MMSIGRQARSNRAPALGRRAPWVVGLACLTWALGGVALAYWQSTDSSNYSAAVADSLPAGATPSASTTSATTVAVSFSRVSTSSDRDVTSYLIHRYSSATASTPSASFTCAWARSTTLDCSEANVPGGVWYYTDTPAIAGSSWAGAESARSAGVTPDLTPPTVVATTAPAANTSGYNNTAVTLTLTATDETGGSGVRSISYSVDGAANTTVTGTHTVSYFATDNAGNSSATQTRTVKIDTSTTVPTLTVPAYLNSANVTVVPVSGTAEPNSTLTLTATDAGSAHTVTQSVTVSGSGTWSATSLNLSTLNQGAITFTAQATDLAGNVSATATASSTKDTVAPTLSAVSSTNGNGLMENGDTLVLSFSEPLDPASLPASPVTVTQSRNGNSTSLAIAGLLSGALPIDNGYQTKNTITTATGTVTLSSDKKTVTVILSNLSTNGPIGPTAGTASVSLSAATALRDVAGNAAQSNAVTLARLW